MRLLVRKVLTSIIVFLTLVFSFIFISYAWFDNNFYLNSDALGRARIGYTSYFAGGTGGELDPFIIAEPEHFSNVAYLQNLGKFNNINSPYYFKIAHPTTGESIDIDFSTYGAIPPIGDHIYPFTGIFDGNYSNLQFLTIDGIGKQDIGVFGYMLSPDENEDEIYDWTASINNLFIEEPIIISNPTPSEVTIDFHEHNDSQINRATGYIIGHLGLGSTLDNVFVIEPTIQSLSNDDANRSQYGLIGYNESDFGYVAGSPRNAYNFALNALSAYNALIQAKTTFGTYYINGSSTQTLNDVLTYVNDELKILGGFKNNNIYSYTLSTLKISQTPNDPDPPFLYDVMSAPPYNYKIESTNSEYSRENINVVGLVNMKLNSGNRIFEYEPVLGHFTSPLVGSEFIANTYDHSIILFVRPTNNPSNMGTARVSGSISGGGELGFFPGFDSSGNYIPNKTYQNKTSLSLIPGLNQDLTLTVYNAFVAVIRDPDVNNPHKLTVVDPSVEWPDFYVFLLGAGNGFVYVSEVNFEYKPAALEAGQLSSIQRVDFIHKDWIDNIILDLLDPESDYTFSFVNFGYELTEFHLLEARILRTSIGAMEIYLEFDILDSTFFYFDILNVMQVPITLYIRDGTGTYVQWYTGDYQIVEVVLKLDDFGEPEALITYYNNTT